MLETLKHLLGIQEHKKNAISDNAVLIDVRSESEFDATHVEGALLMPLEKLESRFHELPENKQLILYCRSGNRSSHAKKILTNQGFTQVIDAGGLTSVETLLSQAGKKVNWVSVSKQATEHSVSQTGGELKILIPTDFSVQADFAHIMASKLNENFDAELHFLHIIEVPDTVTLDENGNILTCGEIDVAYLQKQKDLAQSKFSTTISKTPSAKVHVVFGKLTDQINRFASENQFDLVLMGTKGAWGMKEKMTGSNTQQIARRASVPVMSLMCDRSDLVMKNILYVHDFQKNEDCHPILNRFVTAFGATYHQLHVTPEKGDHASIVGSMSTFAEKLGLANAVNHIETADSVEAGVNQLLAKHDADVIFIGTHGKGGIFHESAAENLVKHLFKPIVLFHL